MVAMKVYSRGISFTLESQEGFPEEVIIGDNQLTSRRRTFQKRKQWGRALKLEGAR